MASELRLTRQGLRDLNYYGKKRPTAATTAPTVVEGVDAPTLAPAALAATELVVEAGETVAPAPQTVL